jgi:hypothetical protein
VKFVAFLRFPKRDRGVGEKAQKDDEEKKNPKKSSLEEINLYEKRRLMKLKA